MIQGQIAAVSNREDVELIFDVIDDDTEEAIDLTSSTIVFNMGNDCWRPLATASTDDGMVTLVEDNIFRVFIPRSTMTTICAGSYEVGATIENADITKSIIIGTIAVLDGNVNR